MRVSVSIFDLRVSTRSVGDVSVTVVTWLDACSPLKLVCMPADEPVQKQARVDIAMADTEPLRVKKLSEHATLPVRGSAGAAGYDLARCVCFLTNRRAPAACAPRDAAPGALSLLSPFPPASDTSPPAPALQRIRLRRACARQGARQDGLVRRVPSGHIRPHRAPVWTRLEELHRHGSRGAQKPLSSLPTSVEPAQHRPVCLEEHACVWITHALSKHTLCSDAHCLLLARAGCGLRLSGQCWRHSVQPQ